MKKTQTHFTPIEFDPRVGWCLPAGIATISVAKTGTIGCDLFAHPYAKIAMGVLALIGVAATVLLVAYLIGILLITIVVDIINAIGNGISHMAKQRDQKREDAVIEEEYKFYDGHIEMPEDFAIMPISAAAFTNVTSLKPIEIPTNF